MQIFLSHWIIIFFFVIIICVAFSKCVGYHGATSEGSQGREYSSHPFQRRYLNRNFANLPRQIRGRSRSFARQQQPAASRRPRRPTEAKRRRSEIIVGGQTIV